MSHLGLRGLHSVQLRLLQVTSNDQQPHAKAFERSYRHRMPPPKRSTTSTLTAIENPSIEIERKILSSGATSVSQVPESPHEASIFINMGNGSRWGYEPAPLLGAANFKLGKRSRMTSTHASTIFIPNAPLPLQCRPDNERVHIRLNNCDDDSGSRNARREPLRR